MCACVYASELILRRSQSPSFFFNNNPGECLQDGGGVEWYWSYPKNLHEIELESWGYLLFGRGRDRSSRGQQSSLSIGIHMHNHPWGVWHWRRGPKGVHRPCGRETVSESSPAALHDDLPARAKVVCGGLLRSSCRKLLPDCMSGGVQLSSCAWLASTLTTRITIIEVRFLFSIFKLASDTYL